MNHPDDGRDAVSCGAQCRTRPSLVRPVPGAPSGPRCTSMPLWTSRMMPSKTAGQRAEGHEHDHL